MLSREEIQKIYHTLCEVFAQESFEKGYAACREYIRKYYSCWQLQFYMGLVIVNHLSLLENPTQIIGFYQEAIDIFSRVAQNCKQPNLIKEATYMQAACYLSIGKSATAIELLKPLMGYQPSAEMLISKAYQMQGDWDRAKGQVQGFLYQNIIAMIGAATDLLGLYVHEPERFTQYYQKFVQFAELFDLQQLHPFVYAPVFYVAATGFLTQGDIEKALDLLERYVGLLEKGMENGNYLKGNLFFDHLEELIDSLDLGGLPPRSKEVIIQSGKDSLMKNPALEVLKTQPRFVRLLDRIQKL